MPSGGQRDALACGRPDLVLLHAQGAAKPLDGVNVREDADDQLAPAELLAESCHACPLRARLTSSEL